MILLSLSISILSTASLYIVQHKFIFLFPCQMELYPLLLPWSRPLSTVQGRGCLGAKPTPSPILAEDYMIAQNGAAAATRPGQPL